MVGLLEQQFLEGLALKLRLPSRRICEKFRLVYELEGAQKGVDVLTRYYRVRRMKIVVDGRRLSKKYAIAEYWKNTGVFIMKRICKGDVLHELYHHLVEAKGLKVKRKDEERQADEFARKVVRRRV